MSDYASFEAWVSRAFGEFIKPHPIEWVVDCPKCGAVKRFSMNPSKGYYNCFKCGGGYLMSLLLESGIRHYDGMKMLEGEDILDIGQFEESVKLLAVQKQIEEAGASPEDLQRMAEDFMTFTGPGIAALVGPYLTSRGFTIDYAMSWGLCYCYRGPFAQRLIIPCFENERLSYFQARAIFDQEPKYLNPRIPKGQVVFNADAARHHARAGWPIYIFEGAFNAMSIGLNAVAMFGKSTSDIQIAKLLEICHGSSHIIVCFDYGAESFSHKLAGNISMGRNRDTVGVVEMPDERDLNNYFSAGGLPAVQAVLSQNLVWSDGFTV